VGLEVEPLKGEKEEESEDVEVAKTPREAEREIEKLAKSWAEEAEESSTENPETKNRRKEI
jgi:predicted RNase H-like HicB family nuclease